MRVDSGNDRSGGSGRADALRALASSRLGQLVGDRWMLESVLGFGGTASVYAARHRNGRAVAIKVLHPELARETRSRKRFLREAYAANRVGHPGAVSVIDDGEMSDGTPFLLLELIAGKSLADFIGEGARLPVSEVAAIGAGILDVLAAAHDAGVVHRDIKPSNVIVTPDRRVKVLDFGIAKFHDAGEHDPSLTRGEAALGTPAFMSPEQSAGKSAEVDARSDLWSVGATLFTLLTGRFVHPGSSSNEILIAVATQQAPSIASVRSDLPPFVVAAVDRSLSLDRAKRWPNARAMKAALTGIPDEEQSSVITIPEGQPVSALGRKRWMRVALAAGATALVAGAALLVRARSVEVTTPTTTPAASPALRPAPIPATTAVERPATLEALPVGSVTKTLPGEVANARASSTKQRSTKAQTPPVQASSAPSASVAPPKAKPADSLFDRRQ